MAPHSQRIPLPRCFVVDRGMALFAQSATSLITRMHICRPRIVKSFCLFDFNDQTMAINTGVGSVQQKYPLFSGMVLGFNGIEQGYLRLCRGQA